MSKFIETNEKIAESVTEAYQKIEDGVVGGYKKIENGVVEGYKRMETSVVDGFNKIADKFVDAFLTKDGETTEQARARIAAEQKAGVETGLEATRNADEKL